jgi:anti-anti-sigma regulatory factor
VSEVLDSFQIEWHGNTVVVTPASSVESLNWDLVEQAADLVMEPLSDQEAPMVVVDLSRVGYFGSVFLALLLRCHKKAASWSSAEPVTWQSNYCA